MPQKVGKIIIDQPDDHGTFQYEIDQQWPLFVQDMCYSKTKTVSSNKTTNVLFKKLKIINISKIISQCNEQIKI